MYHSTEKQRREEMRQNINIMNTTTDNAESSEDERGDVIKSTSSKHSRSKPFIDIHPFADTDTDNDEPSAPLQLQRHKQRRKKKSNRSNNECVPAKLEEKQEFRSPICVVMGHVDAGKTTILDHIRNTNVQNKEHGSITQQIGATNLSIDYIATNLGIEGMNKFRYKVPGLLFIDTPGHQSFDNLRSRGASMCDIAVLVVDLMDGLQPQTIESLNMLKQRNIPFVVALNKIDRCYNWKPEADAPFLITYNQQSKQTQNDFNKRLSQIKLQFAEQELNVKLYHKNKNLKRDVSLVATSGITGEGIPDLLYLITYVTTQYMQRRISFKPSKWKASVLEVKHTRGFGATVDIIISNGRLHAGDTIMLCGQGGQPIITHIRALLLPHEAQEMRVKGQCRTVQSVSASIGVRIAAVEDLSTAVAGTPLFVVPRGVRGKQRKASIDKLSVRLQKSYDAIFCGLMRNVDCNKCGVFIHASTLGSLEAFITFLTSENIPISGIGIGTVSKHAVMKASISQDRKYRVILAFNVQCAPDAIQLAKQQDVKLLKSEVIYHFVDIYKKYIGNGPAPPSASNAVFPVECMIVSPQHVFRDKKPLILGVEIKRGFLRLNTPICVQKWNQNGMATPVSLGRVVSIRSGDRDVDCATVGEKVSVKIVGINEEQRSIQVGRAFAITDALVSEITRESIDALKIHFEEKVKENRDTIQHLMSLKKYFNIH